MTTWVDILADLRTDMADTGDTPKLSATAAFLYGKLAIRDYSRWNPRTAEEILNLNSLGEVGLPTGFVSMIEVRDPVSNDRILPLVGVSNPPDVTLLSKQHRWWIEGSTFRMNTWADLPDTVSILYRCIHALPLSPTDAVTQMTFPDADEEAILLYVRAKFLGTGRSKTARADRYKRRVEAGNTRTDNPLAPEVDNLMDEYTRFMMERYGSQGAVKLVRQRR